MSALHQIMSEDQQAMEDCLSIARPGDEILLLDGGVHLLMECDEIMLGRHSNSIPISIAGSDVQGPELESVVMKFGIDKIDDEAWVRKVCHHDQVLSWI